MRLSDMAEELATARHLLRTSHSGAAPRKAAARSARPSSPQVPNTSRVKGTEISFVVGGNLS